MPRGVVDSEYKGAFSFLPAKWRALLLLSRLDRPIGIWLLYWATVSGLALGQGALTYWPLFFYFFFGAAVMRGAGCTFNDIIDRDIDRKVARTAQRPLAAGTISVRAAIIWLLVQLALGFIVLFTLNRTAQLVAVASLLPIIIYPFMKRITGWPQIWLGLTFAWGALVGYVAALPEAIGVNAFAMLDIAASFAALFALLTDPPVAMLYLYAGCVLWVIGYDTIYALQDREDDALIGIGSSAVSFGAYVRPALTFLYLGAVLCWAGAIWAVRPQYLALAGLLPVSLHLLGQIIRLKEDDAERALVLFRSNRMAGLLLFLACFVIGQTL